MINSIEGHKKIATTLSAIFRSGFYLLIFLFIPIAAVTLLTSRTSLIPGVKSFIVMSGSMEPALPVGSMIYTVRQPVYKMGDIISFKNKSGETVTHRIIAITEKNASHVYTTLGDANETVDQETVAYSSVVGRSFIVIPQVGSVIIYLKTPFGFLSLLLAPCLAFALYEFLNLKREMEKEIERKVLARLQHHVP